MIDLVVDASVVVKWYFDEPASEAARALRGRPLNLIAPHLLLLEVASSIWKRLRKAELDLAIGAQILAALESSPIDWAEDRGL